MTTDENKGYEFNPEVLKENFTKEDIIKVSKYFKAIKDIEQLEKNDKKLEFVKNQMKFMAVKGSYKSSIELKWFDDTKQINWIVRKIKEEGYEVRINNDLYIMTISWQNP